MSFKPSSSSDRVDPKLVSPSRHSVFIRGLPSNIQMESVRTFFKTEMNEDCKIDFFSYSEDRKKLFIALRFETHEKAEELIESFDNKEVLGHTIEVSWFKDLRKARKKLIEDERAGRNHRSRSPVEWNMMSRGQSMYSRNGGYMWNGRFMRSRSSVLRGMGNFSRQRDFPRRMFNSRNTGCWRRARLSPNRPRNRRDRSHSNSHSYSRSQSHSHSRSRSYSSKRSYSSFSSKRSMRSLSGKDIGHDSIHKYRFERSNSAFSDCNITKLSINVENNEKEVTKAKTPIKVIEQPIISPIKESLINIIHTYSVSLSDSSVSSNEIAGKLEKNNGKRHKRKTKKKSKKRKLIKKTKESDENSSAESSVDKKCVISNDIDIDASDIKEKEIDLNDHSNIKDVGDSINVKIDYPNLSEEDQVKVFLKKETLEKAYKKDCETVASVSKLMISKNPNIEEEILIILKSIFSDIGDKYVEELRLYVFSMNDNSTKTNI